MPAIESWAIVIKNYIDRSTRSFKLDFDDRIEHQNLKKYYTDRLVEIYASCEFRFNMDHS